MAVERSDATPFLQTAGVGALMLAMAATPLAAARFAENPYFLLTLKWTVAALLVLPAAAVLIIGSPTLGRLRPGDGVVALWLVLGVLATIGAETPGPAVTRLAQMTTVAAGYFLASRATDRALVRAGFTGVVLPVATLVACYSIAQHLGSNPLGFVAEGEDQLCATFVNRNLLAGFLVFALPIGLEAIVAARRPEPRAIALAAVVPLVAALLLTKTRGAWIAWAVVIPLWALRQRRQLGAAPLFALLLGALGWAAVAQAPAPTASSRPSRSFHERWILWRIGADLLLERPALGWGPGNFDLVSEAKKAPYFREDENRGTYELPRFAHNDAVELSTEMGVPGGVLWLCLMGTIAHRVRREWSSEGGAIALACAAVAVHGLFHWSLHDPVASLLFFIGLGATAPPSPAAEPLGAWVARCMKLAVALLVAGTLMQLSRAMAARTLFERGVAQQRAGQLHEALWTLRSASAIDSDLAEALAQRAVVLAEMGFQDDALRLFGEALALRPDDDGLRLNMGILYTRKGDLDSARRSLERAIDRNPNLAEAYLALGEVLRQDRDFERAYRLEAEASMLQGRRRRRW